MCHIMDIMTERVTFVSVYLDTILALSCINQEQQKACGWQTSHF